MPDKLIIFDYSGTLSMEMAAFARPDNLLRHLKMSKLFALGIDSSASFWKIVNASWTKGSTTSLGYKKVMQESICELFSEVIESRQGEIARAVSNFVDAYYEHSRIDECWRPVLQELAKNKSVQVLIATDHYAEATEVIIKHLARWDIQSLPSVAGGKKNYFVANSADIGVVKAEGKFWKNLAGWFSSNIKRVLLIDDFGANEQSADSYALGEKTARRRQKTITALQDVFYAQLECFTFVAAETSNADLITQASVKIRQFLATGKEKNNG